MIEFLEEDITYLSEKFASGVIPSNLEPVARAAGNDLYTSQQLKQEFINSLKENKKVEGVRDELIKLVEINDMIPCYTSSNLISFYAKKLYKSFASEVLKREKGHPGIAMYSPKTKRIFVLLEYQVGYLLNFNEDRLMDVILHEVQHYCADKLGMKHYELFQKVYLKWFQTFFQVYLSKVNISAKLVSEIPLYLYQTCEMSNKMLTEERYWKQYQDIIFKLFDRVGGKRDFATGYFNYILTFYSDPKCLKLQSLIQSKTTPYLEMYLSMMEAYSRLGYKRLYTFPGQELLYVSEIACMTSTDPLNDSVFPNVHRQAIKALSTI